MSAYDLKRTSQRVSCWLLCCLGRNQVLQESIAHLLKRPVGRPPNHVRRYYASFSYQAGSWSKKRRVVAKVEWHPDDLYARIGFIVTNLSRMFRLKL